MGHGLSHDCPTALVSRPDHRASLWDDHDVAEGQQPPREREPRKKSVMGIQRVVRDPKSFMRELQRAARGRLDKRSPDR
jgi:hypothetical protein